MSELPNTLSLMTTSQALSKGAVSLAAAALILAGCATGATDDSAETVETTASTPTQTQSTTEAATEPEPETASPETESVDTIAVGEIAELPSADFTVRTIEEREMIPSSNTDYWPNYEPGEGERLWYMDIEWTNNALEAVKKECHGPYSFDLEVYDIDGAEMLMVDQPGHIEGQECSTGLRQGETGTWHTAFIGGESEFGWAIFTDYEGGEVVVTLDPDLELTRTY